MLLVCLFPRYLPKTRYIREENQRYLDLLQHKRTLLRCWLSLATPVLIYVYVCLFAGSYVSTYVCMYVCMYVCARMYLLYVCMWICLYVCVYTRMYIHTHMVRCLYVLTYQ